MIDLAPYTRVGVTLWEDVPSEAAERYRARVREAGAEVVEIAEAAAGCEREAVAAVDALMLTGGIDVDPARYGAERHAKVKEIDPARDAMELRALQAALARDIPVLAICRGHQVLNVGFGGSLLQHIESGQHRADFATAGHPSRWHELAITPGTRLAQALGATRLRINSRHHQAVDRASLAAGLCAVAVAADDAGELIEGLESDAHRWVVGVQWHPERPEEHEPAFATQMRRLFDAFMRAARELAPA